MTEVWTHKEMMSAPRRDRAEGMAHHRRFFAQFVTKATIDCVLRHIGEKDLLASTCEHFNDIRLQRWDRFTQNMKLFMNRKAFRAAHDPEGKWLKGFIYWAPSDGTCIAKESARIWVERQQSEEVNHD